MKPIPGNIMRPRTLTRQIIDSMAELITIILPSEHSIKPII